MRSWFVLLAVGCGGKSEPVVPHPPVTADAALQEMPVLDASPVAVVDAAPKKPVFVAVDPKSLPVWELPKGVGRGETVSVFAVDMGSRLLAQLYTDPIVMPAVTTRITGRLTGPRDLVAIAVAKELGVELPTLKLDGPGVTVDLDFMAAPAADLLRILADTGRVNIVAPGALPDLDIRAKRKPWDGVLGAVAKASGRTLARTGNTFYLLPAGATLPALPKASSTIVDIDVKDGTVAQVTAALSLLTPVPATSCTGPAITLRLRRVTVAEALRALAIASDTPMTAGASCPSTALMTKTPVDDLRLVTVVRVGTARAVAFDHAGKTITAKRDGMILKDIGENFVTFAEGDTSLELHSFKTTPTPDFVGSLRRTAALIQTGERWVAFVETADGWFRGISQNPEPPIVHAQIGIDGVHLEANSTMLVLPLGRFE